MSQIIHADHCLASEAPDRILITEVPLGECWLAGCGEAGREHSARIELQLDRFLEETSELNELVVRIIEVANANNFDRLEVELHESNGPLMSTFRRHGFHVEGCKAGSIKMHGRFSDSYILGRLHKRVDQ